MLRYLPRSPPARSASRSSTRGPRRELRRLHAPGRLPRAAGHQPDLDRDAPHRAAADRPTGAHGERDPEVPPQRVPDASRNTTPSPARSPSRSASWSSPTSRPTSAKAARRLVSIVSSGPRCGVYALIELDTKLQLPSGFQLKDMEPHCVNMIWKDGRPALARAQLRPVPAGAGRPARPEHVLAGSSIWSGAAARDANRVEVPFEFIAPKPEELLDPGQPQRRRHPLGPAGRHQAPAPQPRQGNLAAHAHRRQDGLGQVDPAPRPDHQRCALRTAPTSSSST